MFLTGACIAQTNKDKEVQESVKQFFAALAARDSVAMKRWSTADLTLIEYGSVWNMDTLIRKGITLNKAPDYNRKDSLVFIKTEVYADVAWTNYRLYSTFLKNGIATKVEWIETVTLLRKEKLWKLRSLHSTLIRRDN